MGRRHATAVLALGAGLLGAAALGWLAGGEDRADLVGDATSPPSVVTVPTTAPPTTGTPSSTTTTTTHPEPSPPARVRIPSLALDSEVVAVGLEPDGAMEVPPAHQAGWYHHGVQPGSGHGSSVIAGHVDYGGRRGVFHDLRRLERGAEVVVVDRSGRERRFTVTDRFQVDKDALPIPELFRTHGEPALTLITCGGAFDRSARSYDDNVVVRAVPT